MADEENPRVGDVPEVMPGPVPAPVERDTPDPNLVPGPEEMALVMYPGPPGSGNSGGPSGGSRLTYSDLVSLSVIRESSPPVVPSLGWAELPSSIFHVWRTPDSHPPGRSVSPVAKSSVKNHVSPSRTPFASSWDLCGSPLATCGLAAP